MKKVLTGRGGSNMKKSMKMFAYAAAAVLLAGCMVEEIAIDEAPEALTRTFTACFEPQTKTSIELEGTTGKVLWEAGDAISILDGTSNHKVVLTADDIIEGGAQAVFSADVAPGSTYYAVYPYSEDNAVKDGELVTVRPSAKQDGKFGSSHISVAQITSGSSVFTFHNAVSVLKFTQTGKNVADIVFEANSEAMIFDDVASVEVSTGADGTYYFCVPGFSLPDGFTITAHDADGKEYAKAFYNSELTLETGKGLNLGCLDDHLMRILTVKEFLDVPEDDPHMYIVTGTIVAVEDDEYGDFYIDDGTESMFVFGLLTPDGEERKQFGEAGLGVGDVITVYGRRSNPNGEDGMEDATYMSHETVSFEYLFGQSEYGMYSVFNQSPYFLYTPYADQIAAGNKQFRIVNPNTLNWFSITGLPDNPSVGDKFSLVIDQNYLNDVPARKPEVTVGKVEAETMAGTYSAKKVWLYTQDGLGFIVRTASTSK